MEIQQTSVQAAHEAMKQDPNVVYLDVRTVREFEQGHPPRALNVPVVFMDPAGGPARPNEAFLDVVGRHLSQDAQVLVGCQSGVRSQRAAELLASAGYRHVVNVQGGFGGTKDRTGRVLASGWRDSGLPVEIGQPSGRSYEDLKGTNPA